MHITWSLYFHLWVKFVIFYEATMNNFDGLVNAVEILIALTFIHFNAFGCGMLQHSGFEILIFLMNLIKMEGNVIIFNYFLLLLFRNNLVFFFNVCRGSAALWRLIWPLNFCKIWYVIVWIVVVADIRHVIRFDAFLLWSKLEELTARFIWGVLTQSVTVIVTELCQILGVNFFNLFWDEFSLNYLVLLRIGKFAVEAILFMNIGVKVMYLRYFRCTWICFWIIQKDYPFIFWNWIKNSKNILNKDTRVYPKFRVKLPGLWYFKGDKNGFQPVDDLLSELLWSEHPMHKS